MTPEAKQRACAWLAARPCPACRQAPLIAWLDADLVAVVCDCGLSGPIVRARDVPLECFAPGTGREDAAESEAAREWDEIPAHDLSTGEESPWLVVVEALRRDVQLYRRKLDEAIRPLQAAQAAEAKWRDKAQRASEVAEREARRAEALLAEVERLEAALDDHRAACAPIDGAERWEMLEL